MCGNELLWIYNSIYDIRWEFQTFRACLDTVVQTYLPPTYAHRFLSSNTSISIDPGLYSYLHVVGAVLVTLLSAPLSALQDSRTFSYYKL